MKQFTSDRIKAFVGKLPFPIRLLTCILLGLIALLIISGILLSVVTTLFLFFNPDYFVSPKMFSAIEECQELDRLEYTGSTVDVHNNTNADRHINDLEYKDFYIADFRSDELSFTIFAYEFYDDESAEKYFYRASGKNPDRYSTVTSICFTAECFAIDGNKVYRTECGIMDLHELLVSLASVFSKDI